MKYVEFFTTKVNVNKYVTLLLQMITIINKKKKSYQHNKNVHYNNIYDMNALHAVAYLRRICRPDPPPPPRTRYFSYKCTKFTLEIRLNLKEKKTNENVVKTNCRRL